jgi:hypothetical protein
MLRAMTVAAPAPARRKRKKVVPPNAKAKLRTCSVCGEPKRRYQLAENRDGSRLLDPVICRPCRDAARQAEERARAEAYDAQFPPRQCKYCHEVKPASEMVKENRRPGTKCRACHRERESKARLAINRDLGHREVDGAPDLEPAHHLFDQLAAARAAGETFDQAFVDCARFVASCILDDRDRMEWRVAFQTTEWAWRAGWERETFISLSPALLSAVAYSHAHCELVA